MHKAHKILALTILASTLSMLFEQSANAAQTPCSQTPRAADCDINHVNTRGWEDSPYLTPDGKRLYFMYNPYNFFPIFSGGSPVKLGPNRPEFSTADPSNPWSPSNTYMSQLSPNGKWSRPTRVAWDRDNGSCCAMGNSDESIFYFQAGAAGGAPHQDIVYVERQPDGKWSKPIYMGPEINSSALEDNPHTTINGRMLFWTSTRDGGLGGKDIWFSINGDDGKWSQAANMGPAINSSKDEDQIWVALDGHIAYFNRESTIMESRFVNGGWTPAEPVKFETPVMGAEASVTQDGKTMALAVIDTNRQDIFISISHLKDNGVWSTPVPVD